MRCTLLIPHLFWPRETAELAGQGLELRALSTLLARAEVDRYPALSPEAWLCQAFEVESQHDWPIAPLTLSLDGGDPGSAYWLRADPVHIKVSREGLHLVDSALFDVSKEEAQNLSEALNAHFADSGLTFVAPHPKRWYVKCATAPQMTTHPLSEVAGREVQRFLPAGEHALEWNRRFNEAQMLLHAHPANEAREERGEPPVNSVWFWGGGTAPDVRGRHFATLSSDDALATALASAADVGVSTLHEDGERFLACASTSGSKLPHLAILHQLASAVIYGDAGAWRERIAKLEAEWFAPLLRALRRGLLDQIDIVALGLDHCHRYTVSRPALLKVWRRAQPIAAYS